MPTINFALADLNTLLGRDIPVDELKELLWYGKGEFDDYDSESGEVCVSFADTNLPYLWSVEGVALLLKGVLGIEKGIPGINVAKSDEQIIVDPALANIRPFIAGFSAKGMKVDDYLIKQIIQLQEKLCESYGRRRQKIAIGVYTHRKIKFPVYYKAVEPESVEFIPLEFQRPMTLGEILEVHPAGKKYACTVEGFDKFPLLVDSNDKVLSFPPIINSNDLGKVEVGDDDLFIEITGTDLAAVDLSANILANAFSQRGFRINSCHVKYGDKIVTTPGLKTEKIRFSADAVKSLLGVEMADADVKRCAEICRYGYNKAGREYEIEIPSYRGDILHHVDVIEDLGIMYGFDNIPDSPLSSYTVGSTSDFVLFADRAREILVGLGLQEVFSPVLSNKEDLYTVMGIEDFGTVEIREFMSQTYSVVRTWLTPILLKGLGQNKHNEYPQNIFEQGVCVSRKGEDVHEFERIAACLCDAAADFTRAKQVLDAVLSGLGFEYKVEETEHGSFIPGRVARVSVNGKGIAYVGEVHPAVLEHLGLQMPVACFELNLTDLFKAA
ncbi:phenylalanine--tRNA ligase subunit beta [Candidatus Woesearchaeota archaeon]|nr:phenylalanine--tRNA ligase subunit beta [Candidatus Woesearchaeota archaeon]